VSKRTSIAVLGGTGREGSGLAFRWALHGHEVILGSREVDRALAAAEELNALLAGRAHVRGAANAEAASAAQIVVLTVPFSAQLKTAEAVSAQLQGKILVDVTVPLVPPVDRVHLPNGESAVLALQRVLGERVTVVAAFQNVSATHLKDASHEIDCDVLVCGDDRAAREAVVELARNAGMRAFHAGVLANSAAIEAMTSVLIAINKHYKVPASGLRITGVPLGSLDFTLKSAAP
jgi:8-hydroxy-5-deazaflavin:NADPH oxidoreductase